MATVLPCRICTLFCALIACTLVSTARTVSTTIATENIPSFNSPEIADEYPEDWHSTHRPKTTTIINEKFGSKTTLGTPSVTDPNDLQYGNKSEANDVIDNSTKTENDYNPSEKESILTTNVTVTQSLEQPPTGTHMVTTTTIANRKYSSTTTPSTLSGTELNDTMLADKVGVSPTEEVIGNSQKPTNKKFNSTEPISRKDYAQTKIKEPPTGTQLPSTTLIAILKNGSTTTPGTPSVTDLNFKPPEDVIGNSPSQPKPTNGYDLSHKNNSTEPTMANRHTRPKPKKQVIPVVTMRSKNKYPLLDPISSILADKEKPTRHYTTTEWIRPTNKNCKCVFGKNYLKHCKNNEEETTTTKMLSQKAEYNRWEQQRRMSETTTSNIKKQLEESKKLEIQRKVLEMESNRFNTILDILNIR